MYFHNWKKTTKCLCPGGLPQIQKMLDKLICIPQVKTVFVCLHPLATRSHLSNHLIIWPSGDSRSLELEADSDNPTQYDKGSKIEIHWFFFGTFRLFISKSSFRMGYGNYWRKTSICFCDPIRQSYDCPLIGKCEAASLTFQMSF